MFELDRMQIEGIVALAVLLGSVVTCFALQ